MKKIILLSLFPLISHADGLDIKMLGRLGFQAAIVNQTNEYKNYSKANSDGATTFREAATISLGVEGKSDSEIKYGASIRLQTTPGKHSLFTSTQRTRTYIFLENLWGRFELGSNHAVSKIMRVSGASIAKGTGSVISGDIMNYIAKNAAYRAKIDGSFDSFILGKHDRLEENKNIRLKNKAFLEDTAKDEAHRKITYFTPMINDFQLGFSYILDGGSYGFAKKNQAIYASNKYKNIISSAVKYQKEINELKLSTSFTYDYGSPKKQFDNYYNLVSYSLGASLKYQEYGIAVGYYNDQKSGMEKGYNTGNIKGYDLALSYQLGDIGISLAYFKNNCPENNLDVIKSYHKVESYGISADYKLVPGVMFFAEIGRVNIKSPMLDKNLKNTNIVSSDNKLQLKNNKASVILFGADLAF